jgi:fatty-acyl-CoA synthase
LASTADEIASTLPSLRAVALDPALTEGLDAEGFRRTPCQPEDPYCLLYTSGTTGRPKGVVLPHRMVLWNGYNTALCWQLRQEDVSPIYTPLYHAGGIGAFLMPIFTAGGTIVLFRGFDASEVLLTLAAERCTVVLGVPTIFKLLADAQEFSTADFRSVRWFISGGAPLPLPLLERYRQRGVVLKQGYGLTEVGVNCFAMSEEESIRKAGSIGRPLLFTRARLIDEAGREVGVGEPGELLLAGPHVASGYWNDPAATAAALDGEGFFHTGDLARRDDEGFFTIVGRKKEILISGGVNIHPAEIEAELLTHPGLADAAVTGVPHETWGEVPVAFVVGGALGACPTPEELLDYLAARLARFKLPKEIVFLDVLPRTAYGKVVKAELREHYLENRP